MGRRRAEEPEELKSHEPIADLRKAKHCIEREIARLARLETKGGAS